MKLRAGLIAAICSVVLAVGAWWYLSRAPRPAATEGAPSAGETAPSGGAVPSAETSQSVARNALASSDSPGAQPPVAPDAAGTSSLAPIASFEPRRGDAGAVSASSRGMGANPANVNTPISAPADPAQAAADLEAIGSMLRDYRTLAGQNPEGTNAEMMKALMGDNPKNAQLGPPEGQQLNEEGELVDRWGTPYFFHQLSRLEMEVRSAGPDRAMWTDDDIVSK